MPDFAGGKCLLGFKSLIRRKQVDSPNERRGGAQLARRLSVLDVIALGISFTPFMLPLLNLIFSLSYFLELPICFSVLWKLESGF